MKPSLSEQHYREVLEIYETDQRGKNFLSLVESVINHDTWQQFHDDVFALPDLARRLYLPLCFDIGVRGDSMDSAFAFYGYGNSALIKEIQHGFQLLECNQIVDLIETAYGYWQNPESPMHAAAVPWLKMDEDLGDIHGTYFKEARGLSSKVGETLKVLGLLVIRGE